MSDPNRPDYRRRTWAKKFDDAFRGAKRGVRGERSFFIHFFAAAAVLAAGFVLKVSQTEWLILTLCIAGVLTAEMFNSALERMAKIIDQRHNAALGEALDVASAAVLIASIAAAIVGAIIFLGRLAEILAA